MTYSSDNSYTMTIKSTATGKVIATRYKLEAEQHAKETRAYFVLEHQPTKCAALPTNGVCTFENIYLEVEGQQVKSPQWQAVPETPKCKSVTTIVDSATIKITWDSSSQDAGAADGAALNSTGAPLKWQAARG